MSKPHDDYAITVNPLLSRAAIPTWKSQSPLVITLVLVIGTHLIHSWHAVSPFDGAAIDGPFQFYNALRRLDAGQLPGRDFPAFHGLGIPVVHYPLYKLLGGNLTGSELTRQLASRLASIGAYLCVSWLLTRRLWPGVFWLVIRLVTDIFIGNICHYYIAADLDGPGNGLFAIRSLLPLLFVGFVYRCSSGWRGAIWLGLSLGGSWMLGVEQSLALAAGVFVTGLAVAIVRWFRKSPLASPPLLSALVLGGLFGIGLMVPLAGHKLVEVLRYYLVLLPGEQVWYFGVPPNHFIGDGSTYSLFVLMAVIVFAMGFGILWFWCIWQAYIATESDDQRAVVATAVGGSYACFALISNFGFTSTVYLFVPARMALILGTIWVVRNSRMSPKWAELIAFLRESRLIRAGCLLAAGVWAAWLVNDAVHLRPAALSDRWESVATEFPNVIRAYLPQPGTGDLWSTYAGLVEDQLGIFHPNFDYMIHALEHHRDSYINQFAELQPRFVQTMRRDVLLYEEWLQTTTWGFYERVLTNYDVVSVSDQSILWRRKVAPWIEPPAKPTADWSQTVADGQQDLQVPACRADATIAVVRVEYQAANRLKAIPVLGSQGRFLVTAEGSNSRYAVSLPPMQTSWEFPVYVKAGSPFTLHFRIRGPAVGSSLRVDKVSVRCLTVDRANSAFLGSRNLSDQ